MPARARKTTKQDRELRAVRAHVHQQWESLTEIYQRLQVIERKLRIRRKGPS
jgi:hypothetical protein